MDAQAEPQDPPALRPRSAPLTGIACFLQWLVPGMGYLLLGKAGRAACALAVVGGMFAWGIATDGQLDRLEGRQILSVAKSLACAGVGAVYFYVLGSDSFRRGLGDITAAHSEYGTTFLRAAGLLGYLLILDVFDVARGRKD